MAASAGSVKALLERFRNAPPLPREERDKMRSSDQSARSSADPWWHAQGPVLDQAATAVRQELHAMETSFSSYAQTEIAKLPIVPHRWAGSADAQAPINA